MLIWKPDYLGNEGENGDRHKALSLLPCSSCSDGGVNTKPVAIRGHVFKPLVGTNAGVQGFVRVSRRESEYLD